MDTKTLDVRHVVVALDGSPLAEAALPTAQAIANRFDAELSTISVVSRHAPSALAELGGGDGTLLVLSTHARGRLSGAFVDSVAGGVLAEATEPFLVIGPHADRPGHLVGRPRRRPSSWPAPLSVGDVVALVDGSASSEAAVPAAADWAAALDVDLVVMSVAEDAPAGLDGRTPNRFGPADPPAYVSALADRWRDVWPRVRGEVVTDPVGVASGVRSHLAANPVALVVLAATRRTGVERLRHGATAADIVRSSTAPVLVVPEPISAP